jgi:hypothetical protein
LPEPTPVHEAFVLLHISQPIFERPDLEGPRGRMGVARKVDFPAELWPARVLAEQPGWLLVRPVAAVNSARHWSDPPPVLQALGLEVWVPDGFPQVVVSTPVLQSWSDGSTISLGPGTPVNGGSALVRAGDATLSVVASPKVDERDTRYIPGRSTGSWLPVTWLGVDPDLGFGRVGGVPLVRSPRAGRSQPVTRIPVEELSSEAGHSWGIVGSRTAKVRTVLERSQLRDGPGWSHAIARDDPAHAYDGWWMLATGTVLTWSDGRHAGQLRQPVRFDVEPEPEGERACAWWQDLVGLHEPQGVTARWSTHASVLAQTGLRLCFPAQTVHHRLD